MSDTYPAGGKEESNLGPTIEEADDCTLDRAFDLLGDQQRRQTLETLYTMAETVMTTDDLTDDLLSRDSDAADRERVLVRLNHQTLPRLADDGVVDFDSRDDTVQYHGVNWSTASWPSWSNRMTPDSAFETEFRFDCRFVMPSSSRGSPGI